jgi:hypothetical protein
VADLEVVLEDFEQIGDEGNAFGEGEVDNLDFIPVGKCPVRDDQGVGVTDSGEEIVDSRIENSFLKHNGEEFVRLISDDQQI